MKKILIFICFITCCKIFSQASEVLSSDRPGQALSVATVGNNVFQLQPGVDFSNHFNSIFLNSYFRYGISNRIELNANLGLITGNLFSNDFVLNIGSRINASKRDSKIATTLQVTAQIPTSSSNFGLQSVSIFSINFTDNLSFTTNLGADFDENFNISGLYVFNFTHSILENLGAFIEVFGTSNENSRFAFDTGLYYLVNNNFQLDALIGDNNGLFFGVGATLRMLPNK